MIAPVTAIATSVATILFTKVLEKSGESLGEVVSAKVGALWDVVRSKFEAEDVAGKITKAEAEPSEKNISRFQDELEVFLEDDSDFAAQLQGILAELKQDPLVEQIFFKNVEVTGDAAIGNVSQKSSGGSVKQEALTDIKVGGNLKIGDVDQQAD